jgi:hypothetical protein
MHFIKKKTEKFQLMLIVYYIGLYTITSILAGNLALCTGMGYDFVACKIK